MKTLRLLLGDQLNIKHSWFKQSDAAVIYCLFEMRQETDYVVHHVQKIVGFFAAMQQFSDELKRQNHNVIYFKINEKTNSQNLTDNLKTILEEHSIQRFEYQEPDDYRLDTQLKDFCKSLNIASTRCSSEHFYTERYELQAFFEGKKQYLMETFYREMRKKHDVLMVGNQPEGGKWNYDHSNRNKWKGGFGIPAYLPFTNKVDTIVADIEKANIKTMGRFDSETFEYPISRKQALEQLKYFCESLLIHFGDYQDAMHTDETYLFHSRLSFAMNLKLISPKDVITSVLNYYRKHQNDIDLSQVEGFVRQIIGWREYMRGMYWARMPKFKTENKLQNTNPIADFFWTGVTKMNCLHHAITNSLDQGYAHHIQRLMITGNYALLTQTHPDAVDAWYLGIYVDAVEWVQLPNTRGMSQWADGGKIATKPYVSSASYIHKMSNYCDACHYNKNKKIESDACPFNSLYWNFLDDKRTFLKDNFRMKMMYAVLDKMTPADVHAIKQKAQHIIEHQDAY